MASVNRILEKRRKAQNNNSQAPAQNIPSSNQSNTNTSNNPQKALYDPQREKTFAPYVQYLPYNPSSFQYSNKYMPFNLSLYNKYRMPLSCFINPVNEELQYTQRSANQIIRCGSCRAYINYYTEVTKKGYRCSLCGRDNNFDSYVYDAENIQCKQPSYLVDGPSGIYNDTPPENVMIFLIDVSHQAYQCKMLSYLVMVLKDIFSKQQSNQTQLHFYTYDETIHEYDFSGTQVQRTILDFSIKTSPNNKITDCFIEQIRDKLMIFLDSLEEMAQKNTKNGSNFYSALEYVYENVRRTGGKIYIFQASQAIIGQSFLNQNIKPAPGQQTLKPKSILETKNKLFFNRFVQPMLVDNISMAFFIFGKSYKNIRIYSDTCKLTNSELMYYSKEVPEEINKFYYQLYNILNATYYIDTRIQLIISSGWYYTAVYGNLYRLKEHISFKFCHWERSKRICAVFLPQEGFNPMPYFSMQIITNYIYGRKHYMSVNTAMVPFTTSIQTLFQSTNYNISSSSLYKSYLSSLRLEQANGCRNKYISQVALIYKSAFQFYQGKIPGEVRSTILGFLGFLKSYHSQVQIINDTLILQRIITQRNLLQSCSYLECSSAFCPYLFDLTSIGSDRCLQDNFIYPDTVQLKFSSVKEGLFLMDAGPTLYLYISKSCHQNYIFSLFGKPKLSKTDILNEQLISSQANDYSYRVMTLIRTIRELKTYGWAPLYIIRCGQNSINEKNFYLNFYEQKYEEYHGYKITYDQFVNLLIKNNKN